MARVKTISISRRATTAECHGTNFISLAAIWSLVLVATAKRFVVIASMKTTSKFFARGPDQAVESAPAPGDAASRDTAYKLLRRRWQ